MLATTEANKVLPTVVDRCHRFDFARPTVSQIASVLRRTRSTSPAPSVAGGSTQELSPLWMPASSMCSITPPRYSCSPSNSASTSISMASSRNRSTSSGRSGPISVARLM